MWQLTRIQEDLLLEEERKKKVVARGEEWTFSALFEVERWLGDLLGVGGVILFCDI